MILLSTNYYVIDNQSEWVYNNHINRVLNLEADDFLDRIKPIENLRYKSGFTFSLLPTSKEEIETNKALWSYINQDRNSINSNSEYVFGVEFPRPLLLFLKHSTKQKIKKLCALHAAALYLVDFDNRKAIRHDTEESIFLMAEKMIETYFKTLNPHASDDDESTKFRFDFENTFHEAFKNEIGNSIVYDLIHPNMLSARYEKLGHMNGVNLIKLNSYVMRTDDWQRIFVEGVHDKLERQESSRIGFIAWKQDFRRAHLQTFEDLESEEF